jgi:hypothetical protein
MTTIDGFIYKISSKDNKMNYYGYTTQDIKTRFYQHIYYYIKYYTHKFNQEQIVNKSHIYNSYVTYYNTISQNTNPHFFFYNTNYTPSYCTSYDIFNFYTFDQIKLDIVEHMQNTTLDKIKNKEKYYIQHFPCVNKMCKKNFHTYYSLTSKFITLDQLEKDIPILQHPDTHIHNIIHIFGYHIDTNNHLKLQQQVSFNNIKDQLLDAMHQYYPDIKIKQTTLTDLLFKTDTLLKKHHLHIITYKNLYKKKGKLAIADHDLLLLSYTPVSQSEAQLFLQQLFIQKQNNTS